MAIFSFHFNDSSQLDATAQGNSAQGPAQEIGTASKWMCTVCGYIYDPAEHDGVSFEQLPSTWKCPCGAAKDKFVKI
jgi:rubredoxin